MKLTEESIKHRQSIEHPLSDDKKHDMEAWLIQYQKDAYEDQLGVTHWAHVVYGRVIIHITHEAEQYEYYGNKWYMSDKIGYSDDGRKWRYIPELVAYTGGGSWRCLDEGDRYLGASIDAIQAKAYWSRPPYNPKGYMLENGTRATKLLEKS